MENESNVRKTTHTHDKHDTQLPCAYTLQTPSNVPSRTLGEAGYTASVVDPWRVGGAPEMAGLCLRNTLLLVQVMSAVLRNR